MILFLVYCHGGSFLGFSVFNFCIFFLLSAEQTQVLQVVCMAGTLPARLFCISVVVALLAQVLKKHVFFHILWLSFLTPPPLIHVGGFCNNI